MCFGLCETLSAFSQQSPDPHMREADRQADRQTQQWWLAADPLQDPAGKHREMAPPPAFVSPGGWEEEEEVFFSGLRPKELVKTKVSGHKVFARKDGRGLEMPQTLSGDET